MNRATILSLAVLCFSFLPVSISAQEVPWDQHMAAAQKAYKQADYAAAERFYLAALKEAENFRDEDARLATSLNNLASVYLLQGKYNDTERLYKRTLAIWEKEKALEWLSKTVEERHHTSVDANVRPAWDPLRSDPRFQDLLRRMNLEP